MIFGQVYLRVNKCQRVYLWDEWKKRIDPPWLEQQHKRL